MQQIITPCTKLSVEVSSNGLLEEKQQNMYALKHMYMCVCVYKYLYKYTFIPLSLYFFEDFMMYITSV